MGVWGPVSQRPLDSSATSLDYAFVVRGSKVRVQRPRPRPRVLNPLTPFHKEDRFRLPPDLDDSRDSLWVGSDKDHTPTTPQVPAVKGEDILPNVGPNLIRGTVYTQDSMAPLPAPRPWVDWG